MSETNVWLLSQDSEGELKLSPYLKSLLKQKQKEKKKKDVKRN